jgi:hypothetical protein
MARGYATMAAAPAKVVPMNSRLVDFFNPCASFDTSNIESNGTTVNNTDTRILGYKWPRQTGSSFPDCPALKPDGLEKLEDEDGIVCIPSVRGEEPTAERLRRLLAKAYGKEWIPAKERELIAAPGSSASDLEDWLRNDFFQQHCQLFHHRPFVWHIWDGRKRNGFHALVNYHKLAESPRKPIPPEEFIFI